MKAFFALALAGAVAAQRTSCPPNSEPLRPYTSMDDCQCDEGYQAYDAPGWGCYLQADLYDCPANSVASVAHPTSFDQCSCNEGYVADEVTDPATPACTFAYVFHVHGRIWLAPYTKDLFTPEREKALREVMATSISTAGLSVSWKDVLPYSIHQTNHITDDMKDARLEHTKIVLGQDEQGDYSTYKDDTTSQAISIGFAVHDTGASMNLANALVARMKTSFLSISQVSQALTGTSDQITFANTYLWALTGAFWHRPTKKSYTWAPTKASTHYPNVVTHPITPGSETPEESPTPFCKAEVEITFYLKCDCMNAADPSAAAADADNSGCMAAGVMNMHRFTAQRRTAFVLGLAKKLDVNTEFMTIKDVHPIDRATDYAKPHDGYGNTTTTWYNPIAYSPSHAMWDGIAVTVGIKAYGNEGMIMTNRVLAAARDQDAGGKFTLPAEMATEIAAEGYHIHEDCIEVQKDSITPIPCHTQAAWTPTPMPTSAPTPLQVMPGSQPHCDEGTVMEIKGVARLQAAEAFPYVNASGAVIHADDYMKDVRRCMANAVDQFTTIEYCNINVQEWNEDTPIFLRKKTSPIQEQGLHTESSLTPDDFTSGADQVGSTGNAVDPTSTRRLAVASSCDDCNIYTYTYTFVLNVPGQNMHTGNKVFDYMHSSTTAYLEKTNLCIGGNAYVPPKASADNAFRPVVPVLEELSVSSIRYTYIAPALTHAPTAAPTVEPKDCTLSDWSGWTPCSTSCNGGTQEKYRIIITAHQGADSSCPATKESRECETQACASDCETSEWGNFVDGVFTPGAWGACSKSCGWGDQEQERTITNGWVQDVSNPGKACGDLSRTRRCNPVPCPIDCEVSAFSSWSVCNKRCRDENGPGEMRKFRTITQTSYYYGKECPALEVKADCNDQPCPQNCEVSVWSPWGSCDKSCAGEAAGTRLTGAKQIRSRYVTTAAAYGGHPCPALTQSKLCALHPCGATVCTPKTGTGFPLTCTYENGIVYTHHVNDVHDDELFMCYHNYVTEVCTCLCWPKADISDGTHRAYHGASNVDSFVADHNLLQDDNTAYTPYQAYHDIERADTQAPSSAESPSSGNDSNDTPDSDLSHNSAPYNH